MTTTGGIAIRKAIIEKAENGNTSYVREKDIKAKGGFSNTWVWYNNHLKKMEEVSREAVKRLFEYSEIEGVNIEAASPEEIEKAVGKRDEVCEKLFSELIDLKKELLGKILEPGEKRPCSSYDGVVIALMAHGTQAVRNNTTGEDNFQSRVQDTFQTRAKFRHALEGYFGRILLNQGMMSPERATYLRKEKKLVGDVRSAENKKDEISEEISVLEDMIMKFPEEAKKYFEEQLISKKELLVAQEATIKERKKILGAFYAENRNGVCTEETIEEAMGIEEKEEKKEEAKKQAGDMTKSQLADALTEMAVSFNKSMKKEELQELYAKAMSERDEEPEVIDVVEEAVA